MLDVLRRPTFSRRDFVRAASVGGLAGIAGLGPVGALLTACGSDETADDPAEGQQADQSRTRLSQLKVGVIVPRSGVAAFAGTIVERSLRASKHHIERDRLLDGTSVSYELVNAPAEEGADAALRAYNRLAADPDVIGIVWAATTGVEEALPQIRRDEMPIMVVYADLHARGLLDPGAHPTVFQALPPSKWLLGAVARYAADDRGYRTAGLLSDTTLAPRSPDWMREAALSAGLEIVEEQTFSLFDADYGAQLQQLRRAGPHCLFLWGLVDNAVGIVKQLDDLGSGYVDTPTAKSGDGWRPQILANAAAIEQTFGEKAGSAAKSGTMSSWYLRGEAVGTLDPDSMRSWMLADSGDEPTGGEEGAADAFWALLEAARKAGSTDRRKLTAALRGLRTRFASLEFTIDPETHVCMTPDEVVLLSVDRAVPVETDPPYAPPGQYAAGTIPEDFVGPFGLRRATLEANRRAAEGYTNWALENGWGLMCTAEPPDARGADVKLTGRCRIH